MQGICHQQIRWCSRPLLPSVIVINESSPASPSHNDICLPSLSIYIKLNNKVLTPGLEWDPFCSAPRFVYRYKSPITLRWKWQMDSLLQVQISGSISVEIKAQSVFFARSGCQFIDYWTRDPLFMGFWTCNASLLLVIQVPDISFPPFSLPCETVRLKVMTNVALSVYNAPS